MVNLNQTINGWRPDSRDKRSVKQSKEFDYMLPRVGSQEALDDLHEAVDDDNRSGDPQRNCAGKSELYTNYDDPRNLMDTPSDEEAELMCAGCPLLALCRDYADKAHPAFGVYGGVIYGRSLIFDEGGSHG